MTQKTETGGHRAIRTLFIANRGEIARRVIATCARMGITTAVCYSEHDKSSPFVAEADHAISLETAAGNPYLDSHALIEAARRAGAEAIHPGYGFLSENAGFARAVAEAGLLFVGPHPETINTMGDKITARNLMAEAEVPVLPALFESDLADGSLLNKVRDLGLPVLIKAAKGGGGKGMRLVYYEKDLESSLQGAKREAESAFGDGTLYIEKYIARPRHIEIQILGDVHGTLIHLGERECSIQRRHQKILEESPAPNLPDSVKQKLYSAALRAGQGVSYINAGTVEFILDDNDPNKSFFFLEINTRLQVEHPVTELVHGIDIVEEQLRIAQKEPLSLSQDEVRPQGHAVEVRVYAEDPDNNFLPDSGQISFYREPFAEAGKTVRVDSAVIEGSEVSIHYDPMIAKLICHAKDRSRALDLTVRSLDNYAVYGIKHNIPFLKEILMSEEIRQGANHTHFVAEFLEQRQKSVSQSSSNHLNQQKQESSALAAYIAGQFLPSINTGNDNRLSQIYHTWSFPLTSGEKAPYEHRSLFSVNQKFSLYRTSFQLERLQSQELLPPYRRMEWLFARQDFSLTENDRFRLSGKITGQKPTPEQNRRAIDLSGYVFRRNNQIVVHHRACFYEFFLDLYIPYLKESEEHSLQSPMPGLVSHVHVTQGEQVAEGTPLVTVLAMKMENDIKAPYPGTVAEIFVKVNDTVNTDTPLVRLDK